MLSDPCTGQGPGVLAGAVLRAAFSTWEAAAAIEKVMVLAAAGAPRSSGRRTSWCVGCR